MRDDNTNESGDRELTESELLAGITAAAVVEEMGRFGVAMRQVVGTDQLRGDCMVCDGVDKLYMGWKRLLWDCKSCGARGNWLHFLGQVWERAYKSTKVVEWRHLASMREGIDWKTLRDVGRLAWGGPGVGWLLPIMRPGKGITWEQLVGLRRWRKSGGSSKRILYSAKWTQAALWTRGAVDPAHKEGWLVEGEWDALALVSSGVKGWVGAVPGADVWKRKWANLIPPHVDTLNVVYDNDEAGARGMRKAIYSIHKKTPGLSMRYLVWENSDFSEKSACDLRDLLTVKYDIYRLMSAVPIHFYEDWVRESPDREKRYPPAKLSWSSDEIPAKIPATVEIKKKRWLWPGLIPRGALTLVGGMPGGGKSTLLHYITAAVIRGAGSGLKFPDVAGVDNMDRIVDWTELEIGPGPHQVLYLSQEDTRENLLGRMLVLGVPSKLLYKYLETQTGMILPDGSRKPARLTPEIVETMIKTKKPTLLVIDNIYSFIDAYGPKGLEKQTEIWNALQHYSAKYNVATVVLMHPSKSMAASRKFMFSGSVSNVGVARNAILILRDHESGESVIHHAKCNDAPEIEFLFPYTIEEALTDWVRDERGAPHRVRTARLHWADHVSERSIWALDLPERGANSVAPDMARLYYATKMIRKNMPVSGTSTAVEVSNLIQTLKKSEYHVSEPLALRALAKEGWVKDKNGMWMCAKLGVKNLKLKAPGAGSGRTPLKVVPASVGKRLLNGRGAGAGSLKPGVNGVGLKPGVNGVGLKNSTAKT